MFVVVDRDMLTRDRTTTSSSSPFVVFGGVVNDIKHKLRSNRLPCRSLTCFA